MMTHSLQYLIGELAPRCSSLALSRAGLPPNTRLGYAPGGAAKAAPPLRRPTVLAIV